MGVPGRRGRRDGPLESERAASPAQVMVVVLILTLVALVVLVALRRVPG